MNAQEEARALPGAVWRDAIPGLPEAACPEMVTIPPGTFVMGGPASEEGSSDNERPQREVRIDRPFAIGKYAVTFAEWDAAIAAGAKLHKPSDQGWGRERRPVIDVSWEDAQAYVAWLNGFVAGSAPPPAAHARPEAARSNSQTGPYRLPSEAEWEYACRAGTTTPLSFGAPISTAQANYDGNYVYGAGKKGEHRQKTTPVGSFPANPFGLHDMHGNVWEWVQDCYASYSNAPSGGSAAEMNDCSDRVDRGGSWFGNPQVLRSASRGWTSPTGRGSGLGFRVARTL